MTIENMEELKRLVKQTLGIVETATAKDEELELLITAGVDDMARAGALVDTTSALVKKAILTYVKANFGVSNPTDKEKFLKSYQLCLAELSLSDGYKEATDSAGLDD